MQSFSYLKSKNIDKILNNLLDKKFLLYRELSKTFHITESSDFDLDLALKPYIDSEDEINDEIL